MNSYQTILNQATDHAAKLVVVSKTRTNEEIMRVYNQGQRAFGENRVLDLLDKIDQLPDDIQWHFIGHLQTNKVKSIVEHVDLIHSVDSIRLLKEIQRQAKIKKLKVNCLLQLKIAQEESKYGFSKKELFRIIDEVAEGHFDHVSNCGLMGMATFTDNPDQIRSEFQTLKEYFDILQEKLPRPHSFHLLSMGMSGDYELALEQGSTMLRIGSLIFD